MKYVLQYVRKDNVENYDPSKTYSLEKNKKTLVIFFQNAITSKIIKNCKKNTRTAYFWNLCFTWLLTKQQSKTCLASYRLD